MKLIFKYKSGYSIKQNKKGVYFVYNGRQRIYEADDKKDARFYVWCITH